MQHKGEYVLCHFSCFVVRFFLAFLDLKADSEPGFYLIKSQKYGSKSGNFTVIFFNRKYDTSLLGRHNEQLFKLYERHTLKYRRPFT